MSHDEYLVGECVNEDTKCHDLYSALKYELCIEYSLSMGFMTGPFAIPPCDEFSFINIWSIGSMFSSNDREVSE